jgi:hypothetical protein
MAPGASLSGPRTLSVLVETASRTIGFDSLEFLETWDCTGGRRSLASTPARQSVTVNLFVWLGASHEPLRTTAARSITTFGSPAPTTWNSCSCSLLF